MSDVRKFQRLRDKIEHGRRSIAEGRGVALEDSAAYKLFIQQLAKTDGKGSLKKKSIGKGSEKKRRPRKRKA
jgi:hypothetical protein